jgi:hypothetical protein
MSALKQSKLNATVMKSIARIYSSASAQIDGNEILCCYNSSTTATSCSCYSSTTAMSCCC